MSLVLAALAVAACADPAEPARAQSDTTVRSSARDPALDAARKQATDALPVFWAKFNAHAEGYSRFAVKALFPTDDGRGQEALWIAVFEVAPDGKVRGRLASAPEAIKNLQPGQPVEFQPSRIVDWQYVKDGRAYGHFSTRAMMSRVSAAERAEASAFLAPTPLEAGDH
ncbi:DUF2314 domain-containing protein [Phenylobacterium sp.]|uniref:DUF2314 domain-containing protein n=1 Tax=Phenylobacterium sp. TaxID=1871053 RepID=UPI0025EEE8B5|nr:DUF2314 domain-containing protein [Phenylobacterium sp.]